MVHTASSSRHTARSVIKLIPPPPPSADWCGVDEVERSSISSSIIASDPSSSFTAFVCFLREAVESFLMHTASEEQPLVYLLLLWLATYLATYRTASSDQQ